MYFSFLICFLVLFSIRWPKFILFQGSHLKGWDSHGLFMSHTFVETIISWFRSGGGGAILDT